MISAVSKMNNDSASLLILKQVNNGKCITAVRGSLAYIPVKIDHYLDWLVFLFTTILIYL